MNQRIDPDFVPKTTVHAFSGQYLLLHPLFLFPAGAGIGGQFCFQWRWPVVRPADCPEETSLQYRPAMVAMTVAIYAYCGAVLLSSIVNNAIAMDAPHLPALITFLLFPFSYSTWSISPKATLARTIVLSSMAACFGALLLAIVQYYWFGMRAEGGAGNAIVFATVTCLGVMICLAGALSGIEKTRVLRISTEPVERFGATMIIVTVITYLVGGLTGILVGHDILESALMVFLVSGTYLASGRHMPLMEERTLPATSALGQRPGPSK
ncbi:hypothetical protein [Mesorhizobium sp. AR10]|uniref:hypothetical protein n=1 Tax=Mesorhizobium sp. AR10 TaxID=2865839 RepID=UPI0039B6F409